VFSHPNAFDLFDATGREATIKRWLQLMRLETLRTCNQQLAFTHEPPIFVLAAKHGNVAHDNAVLFKVLDILLRVGCNVDDRASMAAW